MMKNTRVIKITIFISSILFLLLFQNTNYLIVKNTLALFLENVMPSLFPFILFTNIIISTDIISSLTSIFKKNYNIISLIIIGFLCGYPMGAKATYKYFLDNKITKNDALYLMSFINNCNPIFIISTIGICIFENIHIGIILLMSHYISAILIGIYYYKSRSNIIHESEIKSNSFGKNSDKKLHKMDFFEIIDYSIKNTFVVLANILGFIIIFNILFGLLEKFLITINIPISIITLLSSTFEVTSGTKLLYFNSTFSENITTSLISFALGFSGFSIIFQIYSCIHKLKIPISTLMKNKLIHGILSFILTYTFINVIPNKSIINFNIIHFSEATYYLIVTSLLYLFVFSIKKVTHQLKK